MSDDLHTKLRCLVWERKHVLEKDNYLARQKCRQIKRLLDKGASPTSGDSANGRFQNALRVAEETKQRDVVKLFVDRCPGFRLEDGDDDDGLDDGFHILVHVDRRHRICGHFDAVNPTFLAFFSVTGEGNKDGVVNDRGRINGVAGDDETRSKIGDVLEDNVCDGSTIDLNKSFVAVTEFEDLDEFLLLVTASRKIWRRNAEMPSPMSKSSSRASSSASSRSSSTASSAVFDDATIVSHAPDDDDNADFPQKNLLHYLGNFESDGRGYVVTEVCDATFDPDGDVDDLLKYLQSTGSLSRRGSSSGFEQSVKFDVARQLLAGGHWLSERLGCPKLTRLSIQIEREGNGERSTAGRSSRKKSEWKRTESGSGADGKRRESQSGADWKRRLSQLGAGGKRIENRVCLKLVAVDLLDVDTIRFPMNGLQNDLSKSKKTDNESTINSTQISSAPGGLTMATQGSKLQGKMLTVGRVLSLGGPVFVGFVGEEDEAKNNDGLVTEDLERKGIGDVNDHSDGDDDDVDEKPKSISDKAVQSFGKGFQTLDYEKIREANLHFQRQIFCLSHSLHGFSFPSKVTGARFDCPDAKDTCVRGDGVRAAGKADFRTVNSDSKTAYKDSKKADGLIAERAYDCDASISGEQADGKADHMADSMYNRHAESPLNKPVVKAHGWTSGRLTKTTPGRTTGGVERCKGSSEKAYPADKDERAALQSENRDENGVGLTIKDATMKDCVTVGSVTANMSVGSKPSGPPGSSLPGEFQHENGTNPSEIFPGKSSPAVAVGPGASVTYSGVNVHSSVNYIKGRIDYKQIRGKTIIDASDGDSSSIEKLEDNVYLQRKVGTPADESIAGEEGSLNTAVIVDSANDEATDDNTYDNRFKAISLFHLFVIVVALISAIVSTICFENNSINAGLKIVLPLILISFGSLLSLKKDLTTMGVSLLLPLPASLALVGVSIYDLVVSIESLTELTGSKVLLAIDSVGSIAALTESVFAIVKLALAIREIRGRARIHQQRIETTRVLNIDEGTGKSLPSDSLENSEAILL